MGNTFLSSKKNENREGKSCLKGEGLYWLFK